MRVSAIEYKDLHMHGLDERLVYDVFGETKDDYIIRVNGNKKKIPKYFFVEAIPLFIGVGSHDDDNEHGEITLIEYGKKYEIYGESDTTFYIMDERGKYYGFYKKRFKIIETFNVPTKFKETDILAVPLLEFKNVVCGSPYVICPQKDNDGCLIDPDFKYITILNIHGEEQTYLSRGFMSLDKLIGKEI